MCVVVYETLYKICCVFICGWKDVYVFEVLKKYMIKVMMYLIVGFGIDGDVVL